MSVELDIHSSVLSTAEYAAEESSAAFVYIERSSHYPTLTVRTI